MIGVQSHPQLYSKLKPSLCYMKPYQGEKERGHLVYPENVFVLGPWSLTFGSRINYHLSWRKMRRKRRRRKEGEEGKEMTIYKVKTTRFLR